MDRHADLKEKLTEIDDHFEKIILENKGIFDENEYRILTAGLAVKNTKCLVSIAVSLISIDNSLQKIEKVNNESAR